MFLCVEIKASIVVMDADSGRVLYSKNKDEQKLIASTTKIMTSIIALENAELTNEYIVGDEIDSVYGSMTYIKKGEKFSLNDLLHGLMLQSGNDAAMVIANNVLEYDKFIAEMNLKAFKLGMFNTYFENPHGLNETTKNYSTAYDMALLMKYATKNKDFINISSTKKYKVSNYIWYNKNKLLTNYKYLIGGKIGFTKASGPVFVSSAIKNNKKLIIVSIDEGNKFELHKNLYEKYFDNYENYTILDKNTFSFKATDGTNDHYYIKNDYKMLLTKEEINKINIKIYLNDEFNYVNVYLNDEKIHSEKIYKINYSKRINELKEILLFWK